MGPAGLTAAAAGGGGAAGSGWAAQAGDGPPSESLRDEINSLRKQIADMAVERDVLMRSAAMWAQQAAERADT